MKTRFRHYLSRDLNDEPMAILAGVAATVFAFLLIIRF